MSNTTESVTNESEPSPSPVVEDASLTIAHEYLVKMVGRLNLEIDNQLDFILNNANHTVDGDVGDDPEEPMKRFAHSLLEEAKAIQIKPPSLLSQIVLELANSLKSEKEQMEEVIAMSEKEIAANNKESAAIEQQIQVLKMIAVKRETEGEMKEGVELDKKIAAVKKVWKRYKLWVVQMIEELFNEEDELVKDILRGLTTSYLKPELDSYVKLSEDVENIPIISMLYDTGLIIRHPYDPMFIRLI